MSDIKEKIGESLWSAVRAIEEEVLLMRHMATQLTEGQNSATAEVFLNRANEAQACAEAVRQVAFTHEEAK